MKKTLQEPHWSFVSFWNLKSLYFTCSHLFSFVVPLDIICCRSLSFVATRYLSLSLAVTRCHLLSLVLPLIVICCHSFSLSVIHCHSFSLDIPLVCPFTNDPACDSFSILNFWYISNMRIWWANRIDT